MEGYLKKQSQFVKVQNDIKRVLIMVYGNFSGLRRRENKANSKPILDETSFLGAEGLRLSQSRRSFAMTSVSLLLCALVPLWLIVV